MIISGLQCAFLLFHNQRVDHLRADRRHDAARGRSRRRGRLTTWHYQWMILHEFLPHFVGQPMVDDVLRHGRRFYRPGTGRPSSRSSSRAPPTASGTAWSGRRTGRTSPATTANRSSASSSTRASDGRPTRRPARRLRAPRRFVGWQTFFDFGDGQVKPNKLIDTQISTPLFNLPLGAIASRPPTALPQRNLLRQLTWSLPSGQRSRGMGVAALRRRPLRARGLRPHLERSTPLWYYVLKEAELLADGLHLGPVGGRIVAEVIIGLSQTDPARTSARSRPGSRRSRAGRAR